MMRVLRESKPINQTMMLLRDKFRMLEEAWTDKYSTGTSQQGAGSSQKRPRASDAGEPQSTFQSKRARLNKSKGRANIKTVEIQTEREVGMELLVKLDHPGENEHEVESDGDNENEQEVESDGDSESSEEEIESRITARSEIWAAQWTKVKSFRRKQHLLSAVGSYAISCPTIEDRYPGLEGQLRLDIMFLPKYTENDGILEAHLNLGLFNGTIALGLNSDSFDIWCCRQSRSTNTPNEETQKLKELSRAARTKLPVDESSGSSLKIAPVDFDLSQPLSFIGEFRCQDDRKLFMRPSQTFADACSIDFLDTLGLSFSGEIYLPMLDTKPVGFEGFKLQERATRSGWRAWSEYETVNIRYGSEWNKS
ncbi:hypothetical protein CC86DRAFT_369051 [Ophiobolus disseminans]|uniref:Uncharacterized protein n=1 Tax=Ophiobolus disseminans TaxID=1469910 RepID=A0A6A7A3F2_9PLEO|nr:hypothetical protein CC86DRAFT_369051 [Ophiobolus disseminans]